MSCVYRDAESTLEVIFEGLVLRLGSDLGMRLLVYL